MTVQQENILEEQQDQTVQVFLSNERVVSQPRTFRCCPLGVQFYCQREISCDQILEITLRTPSGNPIPEEIICSGIVVQCCQCNPNEDLYRVWVYFTDIPERVRDQLHCLAKGSKLLCPFCENF
jgi:hypothetical protein